MREAMPERSKRDPDIGRAAPAERHEIILQPFHGRTGQGSSEARRFGHPQEIERPDLAAQRMLPPQIAHPCNQPTGCQVMTTDIPKLNLTVGYRVLQLARD